MLIIYDFEVFKFDWLVVFKMGEEFSVIINDRESLIDFYKAHSNDIYVGYNCNHYDKFIYGCILNDVEEPFTASERILTGTDPLDINKRYGDIDIIQFDVMTVDKMKSLKQLELFMGLSIKESSVPFNIDRKLTPDELDEVVEYCKYDVISTEKVFSLRASDFKAHVQLIKTFNLPIRKSMHKTKAQLTADILKCMTKTHKDEHTTDILDCVRVGKYTGILNWFKEGKHLEKSYTKTGKEKSPALECMIFGIPHKLGLGGIHGAIDRPVKMSDNLLHIDVASYYPSLMIEHNLLTRNSTDPGKYSQIKSTRLKLKREGKKEEQAPYKIVLNATYGICKDKYSKAYDPRRATEVCVNGQLLLVDLLDKLEDAKCCRLIQSNTDGIIVQYTDYEKTVAICKEWETRSRMSLEYEKINRIVQKDVNNYLVVFDTGEVEVKGAMLKYNNSLDNNLAIRNIALREYLLNDIPVWTTLLKHNNLIDYQMCVKRSNNYDRLWIGSEATELKTLRVFATMDGVGIGKQKGNGTIEKYASTPGKSTVYNEDITGMTCNDLNIDKRWYYNKIMEDLKLWL